MREKQGKSSLIITLLLISNFLLLSALAYVFYTNSQSKQPSVIEEINPAVLDYLAHKFVRMYNQQDLSSLYAQFSYAAQSSLEREHVDSEFKQLFLDFSMLSNPEFSNLEFITDYENKKVYKAVYSVTCENKNVEKQSCLLRFTLGLDKDFPEIFGITLKQKL